VLEEDVVAIAKRRVSVVVIKRTQDSGAAVADAAHSRCGGSPVLKPWPKRQHLHVFEEELGAKEEANKVRRG
jgi:hypothetical protein